MSVPCDARIALIDVGADERQSDDLVPRVLPRLAERIRKSLLRYGLAHVTASLSADAFHALAELTGHIEERTDIVVDAARRREESAARDDTLGKSRPGVYQPESLALHTDRPTAGILAWYCVEQDDRAGETILVDTVNLVDHLSGDQLAALSEIQVPYTIRQGASRREHLFLQSLLVKKGTQYEVFYVPWNLPEPGSSEARSALARFAEYVKLSALHRALRIRLMPKQSLFINNRRMLHGRDALPEDSKRRLIRLYIDGLRIA
jgi:hypothetical protein